MHNVTWSPLERAANHITTLFYNTYYHLLTMDEWFGAILIGRLFLIRNADRPISYCI